MEKFAIISMYMVIVTGEPKVVTVSFTPGDYWQHPSNCTKLQNFTVDYIGKRAVAALISTNTTSAWLPLRRIKFHKWKWMDGSVYADTISGKAWEQQGSDCALLRVGERMINDVSCTKKLSHYICEANDTPCLDIKGDYKCFTIWNTTYVIYTMDSTWYMAKQSCSYRNMTLASFPVERRQHIMNEITIILGTFIKLWIGLRKVDYRSEIFPGTYRDQKEFNWAAGQPCVCPGNDCVVINQHGTWEAANCSSQHEYLCYSQIIERTSSDVQPRKHMFIVGAVIGTTVAIVLVFIVGISVYCWFKKLCCFHSTKKAIPMTENAQKLRENILKPNKVTREQPNILLIGLPGAGKSSLINSMVAALHEEGYRDSCQTGTYGAYGGQITHRLQRFPLFEENDDEKEAFMCRPVLWDCPGFMNDRGSRTKEMLRLVIKGMMQEGTPINKLLQEDDVEFEKHSFLRYERPEFDLVLFVMAASEKPPMSLIDALLEVTSDREDGEGTPLFLVINKIDLVSKSKLQRIKQSSTDIFKMRGNEERVHLVSSYSKKTRKPYQNRTIEIDDNICILWRKVLSPIFYMKNLSAQKITDIEGKDVRLTANAIDIRNNVLKGKNPNILVMGHKGVGKSSVINSLITAIDKNGFRETCRVGTYGHLGGHITYKLRQISLLDHLAETELFFECVPSLVDCYGFMEDDTPRIMKIVSIILSGGVGECTSIKELLGLSDNDLSKVTFKPDETRRIDAILLVHDAQSAKIPENLIKVLNDLRDAASEDRRLPVFLVVNKMDLVMGTNSRGKDSVSYCWRQDLPPESKAAVEDMCAKLGIVGKEHQMVHCVSSYLATKCNYRIKNIDVQMCELWRKILDLT